MDLIYILDIVGTFAFAISGALVASDKKFDLFGVIIIAFVTAVGGGMLRDILMNAHPINWFGDLNYFQVSQLFQFFITLFSVILVRSIAVKFHLELPKIKNDLFSKKQ